MQINKARLEARHGLWLVMLAAVMWGTVGVTTQALYHLSATTPLSIGFFRLLLATPALFGVGWYTLGRNMFRLGWRDLGLMLLIGTVTALYQVCYFGAIEQVGVAVAVLITLCVAPVLVALISAGLSRERPTGRVWLALGGALAGATLLIELQPNGATQNSIIQGVLLALASACGYALITLISRNLAARYHPLQPIAIGFSFGAVVLLPFALATGFVVDYPATGWMLLLYLGVVPTALAYGLFLAGMRHTTATVASIVTLLEPLVSTGLAWLIFGERFSSLGLVGAVCLLGAMALLFGDSSRGGS